MRPRPESTNFFPARRQHAPSRQAGAAHGRQQAAKMQELVYFPDTEPGIRRQRCGRGFRYLGPDGGPVGAEDRARIAALAIPPAYERVWICPDPLGHLQATGHDARGRKQYRYHAGWTELRAARKYEALAAFGRALPRIRRHIARGLSAEVTEAEAVVAAVSGLLDRLALRIGNDDYATENGSYGLTTLLPRHMRIEAGEIAFRFPGKSGKLIECRLRDRRLHRALERMQDLRGARLFVWRDAEGGRHALTSEMVNLWLARAAGAPVSAKTFRTWAGTLAAFQIALAGEATAAALARAAAERLHNTPTVARTSYVHPAVLALAEDRAGLRRLRPARLSGLRAGEGALIAFLERAARTAAAGAARTEMRPETRTGAPARAA